MFLGFQQKSMKGRCKKIFAILSIGFFISTNFVDYNFIAKVGAQEKNYLDNEILVQLKNQNKIYDIHYPTTTDISEMQKILLERSEIKWAEPNYLVRATYTPNDTFYSEQWTLPKIQAPQAWDIVRGGSEDVIIAVLDTGVAIDHPDLKDNIWLNKKEVPGNGLDDDHNGYVDDYYGWDFVRNSPDPKPKFDEPYAPGPMQHGTVVAGLAAAIGDNKQGITGLAWKTKIMALRVLNSEGIGSIDAVIQAVNYAKNNGAKIINLSFVGSNRSEFLAQALKQAWKEGLTIVAAAGNETTGQSENLDIAPSYPICLDADDTDNYIIGVAAVDQSDHKASFSNYGSKCIDIAAPGSRLFSTLFYAPNQPDYKDYYGGYWSGTSVAVPLVSGTIALLKSLNPLLNNQKIRDIVLDQSDDISSLNPEFVGELGRGRLNVYRAVNYVYTQLVEAPQFRYIVTAAGPGGGPHVRIMKSNGLAVGGFMAYDSKFRGGVKVAVGDVNGDKEEEIVTVPVTNSQPQVKIFNRNGELQGQFSALSTYKKGLNVAVCSFGGEQNASIVVAPNGGAEPAVLVYNSEGKLINKFLVYSKSTRYEIKLACGDVDGDGDNEIITGLGVGGAPQVKIFDAKGNLKNQWFAFLQKFKGGINLAVGDVNGDGKMEIVTSIASSASPYIRVFDYFGFLQTQFLAYDRSQYKGVTLAAGDLNEDGKDEIITGTGQGAAPHVRIFDYLSSDQGGFFAYDRKFLGGINLAVIKGE